MLFLLLFIFFLFFFSRMDQIADLLECPICKDTPRPGKTGVGLCPLGHYVCPDCTIRSLRENDKCPTCRARPLVLHNAQHFVTSVVKMYTAQKLYKCLFADCNFTAVGHNISNHEATCVLRPISCPKINCPFEGPISVYFNCKHECFKYINMNPELPNFWSFTIPMQELFDLDNNVTECSSNFPLRFLSNEAKTSRAYLTFTNHFQDLIFHVGWLGGGEQAPFSRYKINMLVHNAVGPIGAYFDGPFKETLVTDQDGLRVSKKKLIRWSYWLASLSHCLVNVDICLD